MSDFEIRPISAKLSVSPQIAIDDLQGYTDVLKQHDPGDEVEVVFLRGEERKTVRVTLVERR